MVQQENKLEEAPVVLTKSADFHTRTTKKVRIINSDLIPREYMVPDEVKIRRVVLAGLEIPGVEVYEEKTII